MILHGNQRAGAKALAEHLLNEKDNDHVTVHEVRGFVSSDVLGAFREAEAISKGTKCKQFLFSLSFNPPKGADASISDFEVAIDQAEQRLGLSGQPRVIIFHEKEGRRHAHVVWSRIDADKMKAVNMAHSRRKLFKLSRELFLDHGWELPNGFRHLGGASPDNFTMAQWQQAKRMGLDPREIKQAFGTAWAQSDNAKSFAAALAAQGYALARGDRRGFVAIDIYGEVYSLPRWLGIKTKDVRLKLGSPDELPSVETATQKLTHKVSDRLLSFIDEAQTRQDKELAPHTAGKRRLTGDHRLERNELLLVQGERWQWESFSRQERFNKGWRGIWDRITGRYTRLRQENALDVAECKKRDLAEREALFKKQSNEKRRFQKRIEAVRARHVTERRRLHLMVADYLRTHAPQSKTPSKHLSLDR